MNDDRQYRKQQDGATLVVGLILLLIMTLIGVTAIKSTALEEKMAGGLRNKVLAEGGVESALREAESFLWNRFLTANGGVLVSDEAATFGVYSWEAPDAVAFRESTEWIDLGSIHDHDFSDSGSASLAKNPRYVIEEMNSEARGPGQFDREGTAGYLRIFRITARSVSGDGKIIAMAESVFSARTE
ncbi:MAG: hypothetical protein JKX98_07600 [Alcanivoracaceae bacterium]|nr:hypothetical protein [Alcanivoracaceae bacterium]